MEKHRKREKRNLLVWIVSSALVIFLALLFLLLGTYKFGWKNAFFSSVVRVIPLPDVYVKGAGMITVGEVNADLKAVQKFYESQDFDKIGMRVDFTTDQGKKRLKIKEKEIINKLVENKITEALARKRDISISDSAVDQEVDASIAQYGNRQNLMSELSRLYGWSLADFKQNVVKPELYAEKLSEAYAGELDTSAEQNKINALYERVAKNKENFEKVAREASEGESSQNGGDLGWSTRDQLLPDLADRADKLKPGEISEVIASPLGFHIVKLEEKKEENGEQLVHLRQIFVRIETFGDWLKGRKKQFRVLSFSKDYQWNANEGQIEFKDAGMRQFEANLSANSEGDPSVFP